MIWSRRIFPAFFIHALLSQGRISAPQLHEAWHGTKPAPQQRLSSICTTATWSLTGLHQHGQLLPNLSHVMWIPLSHPPPAVHPVTSIYHRDPCVKPGSLTFSSKSRARTGRVYFLVPMWNIWADAYAFPDLSWYFQYQRWKSVKYLPFSIFSFVVF